MRIVWSPAAVDDFRALLEYIAADNMQAMLAVDERIRHSVGLLADYRIGRPGPLPGLRTHIIPKTSYAVIYRVTDEPAVEIAAFLHTARDWSRVKHLQKP